MSMLPFVEVVVLTFRADVLRTSNVANWATTDIRDDVNEKDAGDLSKAVRDVRYAALDF